MSEAKKYNELTPERLSCLKVVAATYPCMSHDDNALLPFIDDKSTLRDPDIFNQCHDAGWLVSSYDDRTDSSFVRLTPAGRLALNHQTESQLLADSAGVRE